jgi:hypothetical protein
MQTGEVTTQPNMSAAYARCVRPTCDYPASTGMACANASCAVGSIWTGQACEACPTGQASFGGRLTQCQLPLCPQYYKWNESARQCEACTGDTTSPGGDVSYCSEISCNEDYFWDGGQCAPCPKGMYSAGGKYKRCGYFWPRTYQTDSKTVTPTVIDKRTGLEWQRAVDASRPDWAGAVNLCANLTLSGGGWRLPTIDELLFVSELFLGSTNFRSDPEAFPAEPNDYYWSSTKSSSTDAIYVVTYDGYWCNREPWDWYWCRTVTGTASVSGGRAQVRCVR